MACPYCDSTNVTTWDEWDDDGILIAAGHCHTCGKDW